MGIFSGFSLRFSKKMVYPGHAVLAGVIVLGYSVPAFAGRYPDCGEMDRGTVRDVYSAADDVTFLIDAKDVIETFCQSAEQMQQWEKGQPRGSLGQNYGQTRDTMMNSVKSDMRGLRGQLIALKGWFSYDSHNKAAEAQRLARMKTARQRAQTYLQRINQQTSQIDYMIQGDMPKAE